MGCKKMEGGMTFAEASLSSSLEHNRSLKRLERINEAIDWPQVEALIKGYYRVGTSISFH